MMSTLDFMLYSNSVTANGSSNAYFSTLGLDHLQISTSFSIDSVLFKKDENGNGNSNAIGRK